jgi:hypothetical protein
MKTFPQVALALLLAGTVATAQAGIKASAVHIGGISTVTPAPALVRLDAAGATTLSFTLPGAGKKILTFSAVCSVDAPTGDSLSWADLDIIVNGVVVAPTVGSDDAICSANGTTGKNDFVRASITTPIQGLAGSNTIQIMARGNYQAAGIYLAYIALVVFD